MGKASEKVERGIIALIFLHEQVAKRIANIRFTSYNRIIGK